MNALRRQTGLWLFISVFALVSQMLLPFTHGMAWARQNGDARLFAFCGAGAPAFVVRQARALVARTQGEATSGSPGGAPSSTACPLCALVHGLHLTGLPELRVPLVPRPVVDEPRPAMRLAATAVSCFLPPPRGPPSP